MADEEQGTDETAENAGGGKKKLIGIIILAVLLLAGTGVGTLYFLGFFDSEAATEESAEQAVEGEEVKNVVEKPPSALYFPIKPAFVIDFQSRGRQRFLQTDVILMTRDPTMFIGLQEHLPLIKNRLVMLFGGQVYEALQTDEGRELLRQDTLVAVKEIMEKELGKSDIEQILFTNFVMQ